MSAFDPKRTSALLPRPQSAGLQPQLASFLAFEGDGSVHRRDFLKFIAGSAASWPLAASAQQAGRTRRIGVLMAHAENDPEFRTYVSAFGEGLEKFGWKDGRNVHIDFRWGAR